MYACPFCTSITEEKEEKKTIVSYNELQFTKIFMQLY